MLTITTRGYIEVYRDGVFVSRHTVETKAIESALREPGEYEIRYPIKVLVNVPDGQGGWYQRAGEINGAVNLA